MSVLLRQERFAKLKADDETRLAAIEREAFYERQVKTLPPRYQSASLADLKAQRSQQSVYPMLNRYVKSFQDRRLSGDNLILSGGFGLGKTHAACGIFKALSRQGFRCCYTTCFYLIETIKKNFKLDLPFAEQAKAFLQADCLIIDEIPQTLTAANAGLIFQLVDERYNHQRPMILISNATQSELAAVLGQKTLDRLLGVGSLFLNFQGESLRTSLSKQKGGVA